MPTVAPPNDSDVRLRSEDALDSTFLQLGVVVFASLFGALGLASLAFHFVPLHDPVDVVGNPLVSGFSERREQLFFYVFVFSAMPLAAIATRSFKPAGKVVFFSAVHFVPLAFAVSFCAAIDLVRTALVVLPTIGACWIGSLAAEKHKLTVQHLVFIWLLTAGMLHFPKYWYVTYHTVANTDVLVGILLVAVLLAFLIRRRLRGTLAALPVLKAFGATTDRWCRKHPLVSLGILMLVVLGSPDGRERILIVTTALSTILGAAFASRSSSPVNRNWTPQWYVVLVLFLIGFFLIPFFDRLRPMYQTLLLCFSAMATGLYVHTNLITFSNLQQLRLDASDWRSTWICPALILSFALLAFTNLWVALCLTVIVIGILFRRPVSRSCTTTGLLLSATLLVTFIPIVHPSDTVDAFHDGHILSAVWEFETGRKLFSEVFPLRTYHFCLAIVARQFLPNTIQSFHASEQVVTFLQVGGACALAYAWTRSSAWSLATGLIMLCSGYAGNSTVELSSRQGMHLWMAAFALEFLRSKRRTRWLWPPLLGCVGFAVGYDSIASLTPALTISTLLGVVARPTNVTISRWLPRQLLESSCVVLLVVGTPTLVLSIWQGSDSAVGYWKLFVDNARHINAFFGIQIAAADMPRMVIAGLSLLGAWAAAGVCSWHAMGSQKRSFWLFLLVFFFFFFHRALGRSGGGQVECLVFPALTIGSLGIYEFISKLRSSGIRNLTTNRTFVPLSLASLFAWLTPLHFGTPTSLFTALRSLSPNELAIADVTSRSLENNDTGSSVVREFRSFTRPARIAVDQFVFDHVGENQTLWPIEFGIANYIYKRHNPTRHAIAFQMSSPGEQRIAVDAMRRRPPSVVFFHPFEMDGIAFPVRYYVISQHLYRNYMPADQRGYLIPIDDDWQGLADCPGWISMRMQLGYLPMTWGRRRAPSLTPQTRLASDNLQWLRRVTTDSKASHSWICGMTIAPLDFNYLHMRFRCTSSRGNSAGEHKVHLVFASPDRDFDTANEITFRIALDTKPHDYLIPVGCNPGWSWRTSIDRLKLSPSPGLTISKPTAELWFVDEINTPAR